MQQHEDRHREHQRHHDDRLAVDERDHQQCRQVVDDEHRQQEHPGPVRHVLAEDREHAEGERGVGGHRDAPPVRARPAGVERQVDQDRHDHPDQPRGQRQDEPASLAQVAEVELAPRLEPDDEEEERHQPVVDPGPQVLRDAVRAEPDREVGLPDRLVRRCVDVRPHQGHCDGAHQDPGAAGLGEQERAQRGRLPAGPLRANGPPAVVGRRVSTASHPARIRSTSRARRREDGMRLDTLCDVSLAVRPDAFGRAVGGAATAGSTGRARRRSPGGSPARRPGRTLRGCAGATPSPTRAGWSTWRDGEFVLFTLTGMSSLTERQRDPRDDLPDRVRPTSAGSTTSSRSARAASTPTAGCWPCATTSAWPTTCRASRRSSDWRGRSPRGSVRGRRAAGRGRTRSPRPGPTASRG